MDPPLPRDHSVAAGSSIAKMGSPHDGVGNGTKFTASRYSRQEELTMKIIGIAFFAATAVLIGCTTETKTVEQSTAPSAGGEMLTYTVHNMADFDDAKLTADQTCKKAGVNSTAHYVDRTMAPTGDPVRFQC